MELVVQSNVSFGDFSSFTTGASFSPLGENCRALSVRWKKRDKRKRVFAYCLWVASEEVAGCTQRREGGALVTRATDRKSLSAFVFGGLCGSGG